MASIRLVDLSKSHGDTEVLRGINLDIADGEFMVFVGPSGCAKSTTLRLVSGLEKPTAGQIWIGDTLANDLPPKSRNLAMVFQSYALFPNMTVRGNLAFGMQVRGEASDTITSEVERIAQLLGLASLLERKPAELSGGQAQRVALGRAIIRQPVAFLFDEPLSNLDAELRVQMRNEISSLQKQLGVTTIYVTHDQTEAMTMGDRIAVMREGELMQVGEPMALYAEPANAFVAGFLGNPKINLFAVDAAHGWPAAQAVAATRRGASAATLAGLRSEHVRIGKKRGGDEVEFAARVSRWEQLGHEILLWLEPPGDMAGKLPGNAELPLLSARVPNETVGAFTKQQEVTASFSPSQILFFDKASGERLQ